LLFSQGNVAGKLQLTKVRRVYTGTVGEQNFVLNDQDIYLARIMDFSVFRIMKECYVIVIVTVVIVAAAALDGVGW